jgi:hypothetical protein
LYEPLPDDLIGASLALRRDDGLVRRVNGESAENDRINEPATDNTSDESPEDSFGLPQSTHTLLFSEPMLSLPFAFATVILIMSALCLVLAFSDKFKSGRIPVNVTPAVKVAQYLSIFISILMEEGEYS